MSQKHFNLQAAIVILLITAVVAAWGVVYTTNIHADCIAEYNDAEYVIDSLYERTVELETQLAGYEFADHSKITEYAATK